jgi:hypothetical protein
VNQGGGLHPFSSRFPIVLARREHSHLEHVKRYIARQAQHHRRTTFHDEFVVFLQRHRIEYDERYLWD